MGIPAQPRLPVEGLAASFHPQVGIQAQGIGVDLHVEVADGSARRSGFLIHQVQHPGHGVGAVQQRRRALDHLHPANAHIRQPQAVLILPLLVVETESLDDGLNPAAVKPADDRLGDPGAGGELVDSRHLSERFR